MFLKTNTKYEMSWNASHDNIQAYTWNVEAIFRGIKGLLQHSSVWLLHFLISNGFSYRIATTFLYFSYCFALDWYNKYYDNNNNFNFNTAS